MYICMQQDTQIRSILYLDKKYEYEIFSEYANLTEAS